MANFYEDLAGEAGSDIESDVSDVNPTEMARMLQGLDDMDDALFNSKKQNEPKASPRKTSRKATSAQDFSQKSDKQHVTFGETTTDLVKKKGQERKTQDEDFDWDDPLGDILSSDESVGKTKSSSNPQMSQKKGRQETTSNQPNEGKSSVLKDKSQKEKLVKDLFGLGDTKDIIEKQQERGLSKHASEKVSEEPKSLESYLDKKSLKKTETTSLNNELNTSKVFAVSDTAMTKKKNLPKASAFQKKADEESDDLLTGLGLDSDKKTASHLFSGRSNVIKSRSIMDDIFTSPEKNIGATDTKKINKQETGNESAFGNYSPSVSNTRESRRATPRRETSTIGDPLGLFSPPATPRRSQTVELDQKPTSNLQTSTPMKKSVAEVNNDDKSDWLGLSTSKEAKVFSVSPEHKRNIEKKTSKSALTEPGVQHNSTSLHASDNLPEWLGGSGGHKQKEPSRTTEYTPAVNHPQNLQSVQPNIVPGLETGPLPTVQGLTLHTQSQMEQEAAYALQLQEQQLRTALQLRQHEVQLANVHERQRTLLQRQEEQMQQLLNQQAQRQKQLEQQLQLQQQRIADYMQALMTQPATTIISTLPPEAEPLITNYTAREKTPTKEENNGSAIKRNEEYELTDKEIKVKQMELQVALQQCEMEKKALESTLENLQIKHKEELHLMEDCYKRQVSIVEEAMQKHNARLKEENERIEAEYKERLTKMQDQQADIIEKHAQQLAALQKERINDMQALKDQHNALLEHVRHIQHAETSAVKEASQNMTILQSAVEKLGRNTDNLSEMQGFLEKQSSAQMELRDLALKTKEAEVLAYKENLIRQREAAEEERRKLFSLVEQLELQVAQQRSKAEEERYTLRQETVRLDARIEAFEREKERVKAEIERERQHVEKARQVLLEEQKTVSLQLKEEKLSLAKERARIQALTQLQGAAAASEEEVMQLKAEAEAALTVAKEATDQVEAQKQVIQEQQRHVEKERRKLQELEHSLTMRARELEALAQTALATRNEGAEALANAVQAEERQKQQAGDLQRQLTEVKEREKRLAEEKMLMSQERLKIHRKQEQRKCPSCKGSLIKPVPSTEQSQMTSVDSNKYVDPRKVILKLVAEKERDALLSNSLHLSAPR